MVTYTYVSDPLFLTHALEGQGACVFALCQHTVQLSRFVCY